MLASAVIEPTNEKVIRVPTCSTNALLAHLKRRSTDPANDHFTFIDPMVKNWDVEYPDLEAPTSGLRPVIRCFVPVIFEVSKELDDEVSLAEVLRYFQRHDAVGSTHAFIVWAAEKKPLGHSMTIVTCREDDAAPLELVPVSYTHRIPFTIDIPQERTLTSARTGELILPKWPNCICPRFVAFREVAL